MRESLPSLPDVAPPPGGLARLRNSVEAPRRRLAPARASFALAACALVVLAFTVLPGMLQRHRMHTGLSQALRQAVQPASPGEMRVIDGAALALESGQRGVRLYLVQSARSEEVSPRR